jgi:hypothetical protein
VVLRASELAEFAVPAVCEALAGLALLERVEVIGYTRLAVEQLRRTLSPRVAIVDDIPRRAALDLVGHTVTVEAVDSRARAWVDGESRLLRTSFTQSDSIASSTRSDQDFAVVDLLLRAIAYGAPRHLTDDGCSLVAALLPRDNHVTADVRITPTCVEIVLEHYVD